jgi:hypothetical protein
MVKYMKRWRKENPEHLTIWLAKCNAERRDKRRVIEARYREKHRDHIREYARHWRAAERRRRYLERKRDARE